jgi:Leucine-rich repeat (LRR) protein
MATFNIEDYLNSLPEDIEEINISNKNLTYIPSLERFRKLKELYCSYNELTSLPLLPNTLKELYCGGNKLTSLPILPNTLERLSCSGNRITKIPNLPNTLKELYCSYNQLTRLPNLSNTLEILSCGCNQLTSLPNLPNTLKELNCSYNQLTRLPNIPNTLKELFCDNNLLLFEDIKSWNQFNKFKETYYKLKYGRRLERYYIKNIRNKNINEEMIDIVYSPDFNFYKRLLNQDIIKMFNNN